MIEIGILITDVIWLWATRVVGNPIDNPCSPRFGSKTKTAHSHRPRSTAEPARLMRHEDRDGHRLQHAVGNPAEHEFTQPRVAIASHNNKVGTVIGGFI